MDATAHTQDRSGPISPDLVQRIARRRSTAPRHLVTPGPTPDELRQIVEAAGAAPDHGGLRPCRILLISDEARGRLAALFREAEREMDPDASPEAIERATERALHSPTLLAVIVHSSPSSPDVPLIEQYASAGAALGYALLAADLLGYGAMAVSGRKVRSHVLRTAFALADQEDLLCFLAIGTPAKKRPPRPAAEHGLLLRTWEPPA